MRRPAVQPVLVAVAAPESDLARAQLKSVKEPDAGQPPGGLPDGLPDEPRPSRAERAISLLLCVTGHAGGAGWSAWLYATLLYGFISWSLLTLIARLNAEGGEAARRRPGQLQCSVCIGLLRHPRRAELAVPHLDVPRRKETLHHPVL